jgi:SAM-dependent methyltransferase
MNSYIFSWNPDDIDHLLRSCEKDDAVKITLRYLQSKDLRILEAGCGAGRVVRYLRDRGFVHVSGIEANAQIVHVLNSRWPDLSIIQGDILALPYSSLSFDVVLSYGVVEHFPEGPLTPLRAIHSVLVDGGIAIVTVPSHNLLRRLIHVGSHHSSNISRGTETDICPNPSTNTGKVLPYHRQPENGPFFEYHLTKEQFETICWESGFDILESVPVAHIDGLFHIFGPSHFLVTYKDWEFTVYPLGRFLNGLFSLIPFLHNHMHLCVLRKRGPIPTGEPA